MAETIRDFMTPMPTALTPERSLIEAARLMRDEGIGDVLVVDGDRLIGLVTDRDIVVRCLAEGVDLEVATIRDACSADVLAIGPQATMEEASRLMRSNAIRRLPVVDHGRPIGIISIGDLAIEQDPESTLADVSAAPDG